MKLSKYQKHVLDLIKENFFADEWFTWHQLAGLAKTVRRPAFTAELLHEKGVLERRLHPNYKNVPYRDTWQYKLKEVS